jgi:hypothetical protein
LDLLLIRKHSVIEVAVYHKPTNTLRFIPSNSHCPIQHKLAPFHSMAHRLCTLPLSLKNYKNEYDYIQQAAKVNGYDSNEIDRIIKHHSEKIRRNNLSTFFYQQRENNLKRVSVTFAPKITNKLKNIFRKQNMQIVYRTQNKLNTFFCSTKDKVPILEKSGIYQVKCGSCDAVYYGQSRRMVKTRYNEHLLNIKHHQVSKSSIADHAWSNLHLDFKKPKESLEAKQFKLLKPVLNPNQLDAYESFYIHRHTRIKPNIELMNTDQGNISSYLFNCI